jgi:3-oxoacyl-[acyl-carrier-protein] synthase-3
MFPRQICSKLRADNGCIYGDGAGAWVVSRGEGRYQIRSMHSDYDCELNDLIRGTYGSRQALTETSAVPLDMQAFRPFHTKAQFTQTVPFEVVRKSFVDVTMSVFETCLKDAVVAADRVTWTLFPHYGRRLAGIYATVMNVPIEKTSFKVGLRTGHLGTADPMVAVCKLRCEGGIGKGDRLLLNYQGAGISSAGMLIEVMWQ